MGLNFRPVNQNKHDVFSDGNIINQRTIVLLLLAFVDACFLRFDEVAIWRQSCDSPYEGLQWTNTAMQHDRYIKDRYTLCLVEALERTDYRGH